MSSGNASSKVGCISSLAHLALQSLHGCNQRRRAQHPLGVRLDGDLGPVLIGTSNFRLLIGWW